MTHRRADSARRRSRELFATHDALVNNMRAGAPDKVVYEAAASCLPVLASNPIFDELLDADLRFTRWDPGALAERVRALADARPGGAERARPQAARARRRRAFGAVVGAWHPRRGGDLVRDGVVLHTQKVAGISGSEAHLLQLLPDLRGRGWDVRFLMLHEDEPGAWEFARELEARGVPLDGIRLRADVDPIAFGEIAAYLAHLRPTILHTHLVHADVYGQLAGSLSRVPLRLSTKHGFNEFREGRWFGVADRSVSSLAHVHVAISRGLAQYLAETEGFHEEDFEIVHYGVASSDAVEPYAGDEPRLVCVGRLIPIKGHVVLLRALARARADVPEVSLDVAGRGPARAGAQGLRAGARDRGRGSLPRLRLADRGGDRGRRHRRRALARRGLRDGRARGDGAGAPGDRELGRRPPRDRRGRRDRASSVPPADVGALAEAIVELAGDLPRAARDGKPPAVSERSREFTPERCVERIEGLYLRALVGGADVGGAAAAPAAQDDASADGGRDREQEVPGHRGSARRRRRACGERVW